MTKTIIPLAIIAILPFGAWADYTYNNVNTPARVVNDGTAEQARAYGPYQIATIGEHDDEHIATTAYVKGAYNDSIRAVNKMYTIKQGQLFSDYEGDHILIDEEVFQDFDDIDDSFSNSVLVSAFAVKNALDNKRVKIYTTWDTTDTTQVELDSAQ